MRDADKMTAKELRELANIKEREESLPMELVVMDWEKCLKLARDNIESLYKDGCEVDDIERLAYEGIMEVVYGKGVWDFVDEMNK